MKSIPPTVKVLTVETPWGWIAAAGSSGILNFLTMGHTHETAAIRAVASATMHAVPEYANWHPRLAKMLAAYAAGRPTDFRPIEIDERHYTTFQSQVVNVCRSIPTGETLSYGELAAQAGAPGAARAVGSVMAKNRYPLIVPCHRVIASGGRLGGFSAPQGLSLKQRLLDMEAGVSMATKLRKHEVVND
jgi:methylated-DNA-[protein]-cysteine S-methyltransferase